MFCPSVREVLSRQGCFVGTKCKAVWRPLILKDFIFVVRCEFGLSHVAFFGFSGHMRVG